MSEFETGTNGGDEDMHPMSKLLFGWVEAPNTGRIIFWAIAGLAAILILADLVVHRHIKEDIEGIFGAYGWYGFLAFGGVVLTGWPLGQLLRRGEDYYGDAEPDGNIEEAE